MLQMRRSRGAFSGFLLMLLGLWGALIPFIGPYFHRAYTPDKAWTYNTGRLWLELLPGAAVFVGGRLLTESDDSVLAARLRDSHPDVARAAGFALAELGRTGIEMLERQAVSPHRAAAGAALEALERVKIGRCQYARV